MRMAITIYDVAKHAGVAPSTVSRYLNGYGVRKKNRQRIEQAIEALGFKENLIAKGLKRSRLMSIAVLMPNYSIFFMTITEMLERILATADYSLLLGNYEDDPTVLQQKLDFAEERFVNGLVLFASRIGMKTVPRLQQYLDKQLPVVLVEEEIPGFTADVVSVDNAHASFRAVEKLILAHHTRIVVVSVDIHRHVFQERLRGYYSAMETYNLPVEPEWIITKGVDAGDYVPLHKLFDLPQPPTAIFATTYHATVGTVIGLHQRHLKIPDDVSLIGFDKFGLIDVIEPPLTLVSQPFEKIAQTVAELLLKRLHGDYSDFPQTVTLNTQMLMGESVKTL
jgi:LacI family transcriptional regulator